MLQTRGSPVSVVVELEGLFSGLRPFFAFLSAFNRLFVLGIECTIHKVFVFALSILRIIERLFSVSEKVVVSSPLFSTFTNLFLRANVLSKRNPVARPDR